MRRRRAPWPSWAAACRRAAPRAGCPARQSAGERLSRAGRAQDRSGCQPGNAYLQARSGLVSLAAPASLAEAGIQPEDTLTVCFRLLGGKGGFGALLRGAGRAAATDNTDAYRDLSGRRLRHVHADERLREWAKQSQEMQRQLAELTRLKREEKASKTAAAAEVRWPDSRASA